MLYEFFGNMELAMLELTSLSILSGLKVYPPAFWKNFVCLQKSVGWKFLLKLSSLLGDQLKIDIILQTINIFVIPYQMGICQEKGQKNLVYSTKSLMDKSAGTKKTHFYFSTQPLDKLNGDCLLILSNDKNSIKKSKFLKNSKQKSNKIFNQYKNACKSRDHLDGEAVLFKTFVSGSQFEKIAIMLISQQKYQDCQQTNELSEKNAALKQKFRQSINNILQQGVKSIVITQLEWQSWINKANIFKFMSKTIIDCQNFKSVVFACLIEQSQNFYMKLVQQLKQSPKND